MTAANLNSINYSCRATLQCAGLIVAGVPNTYNRTFFGGRYSEQIDQTPYTGLAEILVHQGGLRHRRIPASVKKMFREEVMPALAEYSPKIDRAYNGTVKLHFNKGFLTNFELSH